ncbi:hypothetical protein [Aureivirga sp. CE67]|uniref:hypothetical protein n=1 Tax=Aureivirga sp. CE67 TaxID=1788983 RepID=UPI0018C95B65|nr:hypothetical protein [Aureivirga sp. CE67]
MERKLMQKLVIEKDISKEEIEKKGKFVVFQYCISIVLLSMERISPAIYVETEEDFLKYKKKYNLYTYLFGWWAVPWGPIKSLQFLKNNKKGALDVTEDILLNLTEEGVRSKEIEMKMVTTLFTKPNKYDHKGFVKVFEKLKNDIYLNKVVVGLYLAPEDNTEPYFMIGVSTKNDLEVQANKIETALYKVFRKDAYFEYIDLDDVQKEDFGGLLLKQGELYLGKNN